MIMQFMNLAAVTVLAILMWNLDTQAGINIPFEQPSEADQFNQFTNGSFILTNYGQGTGIGGSNSVANSDFTRWTLPERFDLLEAGDSATVSYAFKTPSIPIFEVGAFETIGEVYFIASDNADIREIETYSISAEVAVEEGQYYFSVIPRIPPNAFVSLPYLQTFIPALTGNNWYEIDLTLTRENSAGQLQADATLTSLGANGLNRSPIAWGTTNSTIPVDPRINFANQPEWFGGFSTSPSRLQSWVDDFSLEAPDVGPDTIEVTIGATVDAQLRPGNSFPIGDLQSETIQIDGGSGTTFPELDALVEFSLSDIPERASILSASLLLDPLFGNPITIQAHGYAGDGVISLSDEFASTELLGSSSVGPSANTLNITIDADYIESLLGEATHIGLRLQSAATGDFNRIASMESTSAQGPRLIISFSPPGLLGDFNDDGLVDAADYTTWRDGLGTTYTPADYAVWKDNYGNSATSNSSTVPEPTTLLMLLAIVLPNYRPKRPWQGDNR